MKTKRNLAGVSSSPKAEPKSRISEAERELSTELNRLIGEANCEAALLPTRRTLSKWTSEEIDQVVIECQSAVIATLLCAVELQSLDELDKYSRIWIREATQQCEEHYAMLKKVMDGKCAIAAESD